ncbi:MAG: thiolase family protein [Proteobacteria bacterium]|nr:thiolase family protein [Pseudomonadota bacterium]
MKQNAIVAGVGMTSFGKHIDRGLKSLAGEAISQALRDAGLDAADIEAAYMGNAAAALITGQVCVPGEIMLREIGIGRCPVINVENACATGSTAFHQAATMVTHGAYDVVLACGYEKLFHADKSKSFAVFSGAADVERMDELKQSIDRKMREVGLTADIDGAGANRSVGDGAAAVILVSERKARQLGIIKQVRVRASAFCTGWDFAPGENESTVFETTIAAAYESAGLGPQDLSVVELHDASAPSEIMHTEYLGLCPKGGGGPLVESGATRLGGRIPVSTSGGLLRKGHPIGATGIAQLVELTEQLQGRSGARQVAGAKVGLAENGGGFVRDSVAALIVTILSV